MGDLPPLPQTPSDLLRHLLKTEQAALEVGGGINAAWTVLTSEIALLLGRYEEQPNSAAAWEWPSGTPSAYIR